MPQEGAYSLWRVVSCVLGSGIRDSVASPASLLKEGNMLTHYSFQAVNSYSFSLCYGSSLLQAFCFFLLLSAPFLPLTKLAAPQACKCLWHRGWSRGSLPVNVWLVEWKPIRLLAHSFQWILFHPYSFTGV